MSKRLAGRCGYPAENPFAVTLHPERLDEPLMNKQLIAALLVAAALSWAGYDMQDRQAELEQRLIQVQQERDQLAWQMAGLEAQIREIQESNEMTIAVTTDLDERLARAERK